MAGSIGYQVDQYGRYILDSNGNKIPKDTRDVRTFPRSVVNVDDMPELMNRMRSEILRRSGFKLDEDGRPILDDDGNPVLLVHDRVDMYGRLITDSSGKVIPLGQGHVSRPVVDLDSENYDASHFELNTKKVAEGKKILAESGFDLLNRIIYICELFDKRLTKYPEVYDNIPKGFDTATIDRLLTKLESESMLDSRSSCRSWCTGLCIGSCGSSCSDVCYAVCDGCSQGCKSTCANSCGDSCRNDCNNTCFATCSEVCLKTCLGSCKTTCDTACVNKCSTSCDETCVDGCTSCSGVCATGCKTACVSCSGTCSGSGCKSTCNHTCNAGCSSGCKSTNSK